MNVGVHQEILIFARVCDHCPSINAVVRPLNKKPGLVFRIVIPCEQYGSSMSSSLQSQIDEKSKKYFFQSNLLVNLEGRFSGRGTYLKVPGTPKQFLSVIIGGRVHSVNIFYGTPERIHEGGRHLENKPA